MQTLEERNTQTDAPQVGRICDPTLNRDLKRSGNWSQVSVCQDVKTSSNSPKWTNSERGKQNLRVSATSKKNIQIQDFKRYTEGMNFSQKIEYLNMSEVEKTKIIEKVLDRERKENKQREKEEKEKRCIKNKSQEQVSVFVLNMRGQPLMPCSPRKARLLLKNKKAKVVKRLPFTIQLNYATGENKQPIKLGIDSGYEHVGLSAITKKRELLSADVVLRTDIPNLMIEKAMYRRGRRNRNTRYREPRWLNRGGKERREGWLAPSIQHKLDSHVRLIDNVKKILPINDNNITIEVATFDTQKMINPEISGIEYQRGTLQGYEVREYLLEKWNRKCAYCLVENVPFETEHIIPTSRGGSNRISNLTIACHECNQKKGNLTAAEFGYPNVQILAQKSLKDAAFMNIVRWKLVNSIPECHHTYGYIAKYNRMMLGLEKSHVNDAFVIATGESNVQNIIRCKPYHVKQIRRNNRTLQLNRKGFKPSIRRNRYKFQPGDLVLYNSRKRGNGEYISKGISNYGQTIVLANPIPGEKDIYANVKDVKIIKYGKGFQFSYPDSYISIDGKKVEKTTKQIIENIETDKQYDMFGEDVVRQSKKIEKIIKEKNVKTQYDIFGKIIKQKKSKNVKKKIETIESIDTTAQAGIDNAWN